jgi:hypothetical protein
MSAVVNNAGFGLMGVLLYIDAKQKNSEDEMIRTIKDFFIN